MKDGQGTVLCPMFYGQFYGTQVWTEDGGEI